MLTYTAFSGPFFCGTSTEETWDLSSVCGGCPLLPKRITETTPGTF